MNGLANDPVFLLFWVLVSIGFWIVVGILVSQYRDTLRCPHPVVPGQCPACKDAE